MKSAEDLSKSLAIGWCDPGTVDSFFMASVLSSISQLESVSDVRGIGFIQNVGNQIAKQRQELLFQFEESGLEWLLWIDSDIMFDLNHIKLLWDVKDIEKRPIVTGIYFVSFEPYRSLYKPTPCIFTYIDEKVGNRPVHPLPHPEEDILIPIDSAGLGFTLMHKSVAHKLREKYGNTTFAIEIGDRHVSEDVSFFSKVKELDIPFYAHNLCRVTHVKRFLLDDNYYRMWHDVIAPQRDLQEKSEEIANSTEKEKE